MKPYYLEAFDDFVGLAQAAPNCPAGFVFSNGQCVSAVGAALTSQAAQATAYTPVTENTKCAASDCNCWYSKAVNNIEYYNTANKTVNEYQTYRDNFAARYIEYLKCAKAAGMTPQQLNINTPPPGVVFSAPGAGANVLANAGGGGASSLLTSGASSLLSPGAGGAASSGSMMEKIGISVGGAMFLGVMVLLLTGKKKVLAVAGAPATHASPVPGRVGPVQTRYITRRIYPRRRRR